MFAARSAGESKFAWAQVLAMSHRAGTGDAPIPGLVTSSLALRLNSSGPSCVMLFVSGRNPAYKQRLQKQKVVACLPLISTRCRTLSEQEAEAAAEAARRAEIAKLKAAKQPGSHPDQYHSWDRASPLSGSRGAGSREGQYS